MGRSQTVRRELRLWTGGFISRRAVEGLLVLGISVFLFLPVKGWSEADSHLVQFEKSVRPILENYCYDCHGDGMDKGGVAFDTIPAGEIAGKLDLWWAVLKNVRAGIMPPEKKPRPTEEEKQNLERWIKFHAFGIDPKNPDPGRVTLRRLNRVEYRNTIRDLMGIDFRTDEEFPPDDTGYGFDNIGDVLTMSPLLLEKYMQAAESIVAQAVPRVAWVIREQTMAGSAFRKADGSPAGERLSFYDRAELMSSVQVEKLGKYRLIFEFDVQGQFDFDPGRCMVVLEADGQELGRREFGWQNNKRFRLEYERDWEPGSHELRLELEPLVAADQKKNSLDLRFQAVQVQGPLDRAHWVRPKNFDLFFTADFPESPEARREHAREVLAKFARKAFRRPVESRVIDRLVELAEVGYTQPGKNFPDGIAQAMVAVLASPRFLFRIEETEPPISAESYPFIDEYALASRLSYFLWSTMPDAELTSLAERRQLRANLEGQVKRMLADSKSKAFTENFTGQWLQVRDIDGIAINSRVVLARDSGEERELRRLQEEFRARLANQNANTNRAGQNPPRQGNFQRLFRPTLELDRELREAMRRETELFFAHIVLEDRSVTELIDSDYTFLNERLAKHYGMTNVTGREMRRVSLPADNPRGGVLTHGTVLVVTSNPTRTSPVKRGLFILDNILGAPPPPPPPDIPQLEEAEKEFKDREPTLREILELHRSKPLCHSCHNRMDPLGIALENFNALGMWREKERGQAIDAAGKLVTGESFSGIRELKRVLVHEHRLDFYRCLTEKLLTYALGRGLTHRDVHTVDEIVDRLERENGRFSALLNGVIESAPFQKRRIIPDRIQTTSSQLEHGN